MGVIKRGILGGFSGKVAGVVGGSWKGIAYMRSLPLSVANPRTPGQVTQRDKFAGAVNLAVSLLATIVKPLWDRFAQQMSGFNSFVRANIANFDTNGDPIYNQIVISQGSLLLPSISGASASNGSPNVAITWTNNGGTGNASNTDEIFAFVLNETQDTMGIISFGAARSVETQTVVMPDNNVTADILHIYFAFRKADGTLVSNTQYDTLTV
jgi:hypothetical protein